MTLPPPPARGRRRLLLLLYALIVTFCGLVALLLKFSAGS